MLLLGSKALVLFTLVASAVAAPTTSIATTSTSPSASATASSVTKTTATPRTTALDSSSAPTSTQPINTSSVSGQVVTVVTAGTTVRTWISGQSNSYYTTSFAETITLYPENVSIPTPSPSPIITNPTTSSVPQTTTSARNGASAGKEGGLGFMAVMGIAGAVAVAL